MAKKKHYEYHEKKSYDRDSDGLRQRSLKSESRWKFNPNQEYESDEFFEEEDSEFDDRR